MSAAEYTPRAGALAARLIEHLQTQETGFTMSVPEIASTFEVLDCNVGTVLRKSVDAGLLEISKREGERARCYSLPAAAEEVETLTGPLTINCGSTGDLWFVGATMNADDGSVLLTQQQLQQLVSYATTPPVLRPAAAAEVQS